MVVACGSKDFRLSYSIVNEAEEKKFSVYVIHSLPLLMSVIQVFIKERMVMVCHLVGADTIGHEKGFGLDMKV